MKKPSTDCRQPLRPKRVILKITKRTPKYERVILEVSFDNSHGSSWSRGSLLGKGGFGSVFLAQVHTTDHIFTDSLSHDHLLPGSLIAVKSSLVEDSSTLQFEKKVFDELMSCPNIVRCYGDEITKTASGKQVYNLLLEYCSEGSLHDHIDNSKPNGGLSEMEVRRYTRDIVNGIASIHGSGYTHCDIKPENILLNPSVDYHGGYCLAAKIADFGLAKKTTNVVTIDEDEIRGTKPYMAPESLRDSYMDWPVDIWGVGCVVFEMLTGKRVKGSLAFEVNGLSDMAIDFLRKCLARNPYERFPAGLLLDHPFIYNFNENNLI